MTPPPRAAFEVVYEQVWTDEAFLDLTTDARLLFLWSWTQPRAAVCGLYSVATAELEAALGWNAELSPRQDANARARRVRDALEELARKPLLLYDADGPVLWVVNRARYANISGRVAAMMRREFRSCPASPLKGEFERRYRATLRLEERARG